MMEIQQYLQNHTFEQLTEDFGIKVKQYPEDGIVLLDYDQINTGKIGHKAHPIIIECRSLILYLSDLSVASRKFDRFFSLNEVPEYYEDFNFGTSVAFEKCDGSLIGIYFSFVTYQWEISTRGMAKAEGEHIMGGTFREKVIDAFGLCNETEFQQMCEDILIGKYVSYIYEYTSPENRIVVKYDKPCMVLLDIRTNDADGASMSHTYRQCVVTTLAERGLSVRLPKMYNFSTPEDAVKAANELSNLEEGFVVLDYISNKRVKIKSANYLAAHKLRGNDPVPSSKNVYTMIFSGDADEFCAYFPEYNDIVREHVLNYMTMRDQVDELWVTHKNIADQKEFALAVKDYQASGLLFSARKNGTHPNEEFEKLDIVKKLRLMGV